MLATASGSTPCMFVVLDGRFPSKGLGKHEVKVLEWDSFTFKAEAG